MGSWEKSFKKSVRLTLPWNRPDVINYIRTRLRFCLLRSVLLAIRGVRGKSLKEKTESVSSISFNLVENGSTDM